MPHYHYIHRHKNFKPMTKTQIWGNGHYSPIQAMKYIWEMYLDGDIMFYIRYKG